MLAIEVFLDSDLFFIEDQGLLFVQLESNKYLQRGLLCGILGSFKT